MAGGLVTGWMWRSVINALHPSDEVVWERNEELLGLEISFALVPGEAEGSKQG